MHPAGEIAVEQWPKQACDPEEQRLVRATLDGERAAFDVLARRHLPQLASVVRRFVPDPHEVEDVVQEALVRAYRRLGTFRGQASFRSWLIRIAVNLCKKRRLAFWRRKVIVTDDADRLQAECPDPRARAEEAVVREAVAQAVGQLPDRLRLPLVLHVYDGLTGAEVAAALGWNESTVWSRIYAAQRRLRREFADW